MSDRVRVPSIISRLVRVTVVFLLVLTLEASPAAAASQTACQVQNNDKGKTYARLQQAVDAARPSAHLVVKGTCHGGTFIDKDLVIRGVRSRRLGWPVLDGDGTDRVLIVAPGVNVTLRSLTIQDGRARMVKTGAGITNRGHLTLRDNLVRRNRTSLAAGPVDRPGYVPDIGGGIYNEGSLFLLGSTTVAANTATHGGGIYNTGMLLMSDFSSIRGNRQHRDTLTVGRGYGVYNTGTLTMRGSSNVTRNLGGGYWNPGYGIHSTGVLALEDSSLIRGNSGGVSNAGGTVAMLGSSTITDNHLGCPPSGSSCINWLQNPPHPAGLDSRGGTVTGVVCGPGGNVYGNTPDDCYVGP